MTRATKVPPGISHVLRSATHRSAARRVRLILAEPDDRAGGPARSWRSAPSASIAAATLMPNRGTGRQNTRTGGHRAVPQTSVQAPPSTTAHAAGNLIAPATGSQKYGRQSGEVRYRRPDTGQKAISSARWIDRRTVRKPLWPHFSDSLFGHDPSLCHCPVGSPMGRVGVTPSDACGLGRAPSSAKGWVLTMLARKGELCVALVPRKGAPFSPPAYARPKKPHPRGRTPARRRRDRPGRETGSKS